jgi:hypothetical protein
MVSLSSFSQVKHPRAFQLEKSLQSDIENSLKMLLQDQPFSVSVFIDPLRRVSAEGDRYSLPLLEVRDSVSDEWDDPDRFDYELLARVNRISVSVSVPANTPKAKLEEIKSLLKKRIPYVEGRDLVQVETKDFVVETESNNSNKWLFILGGVLLLGLGLIHLLVNLVATNRISKAIRGIKVDVNASSSSSGVMAAAPSSSNQKRETTRISGGDLQLHDTIKMTELVQELISSLEAKKAFPVLEDLVLLEEEIKKNPDSVGALINSFPDHLREAVFSYSYSEDWFKVLSNGGILDAKSFELMNRLVKHARNPDRYLQETLLMRCWIAQDNLVPFLKSIDHDDSILILRLLPRGLAVSLGREVIPGRWATLLDPTDNMLALKELPELTIRKYIKQLDEVRPLRDASILEAYKKDLELISYLRSLDPVVEKEIYLASGEGSSLWKLRSPFYPVMEASEGDLKPFVSQVNIEDWAYAFFNIPKSNRLNIEKCFTDRQKFMLIDLLKKFDRSGLDAERISYSRDKIGSQWASFQKGSLKSKQIQNESSSGSSDSVAA